MTELVCELIISLDGCARSQRSPAYYGYFGPDFADWIKTNTAVPHRMLIGRRSYEMLNGLPAEVRDEGYETIWMGGATSSYATPKEELPCRNY